MRVLSVICALTMAYFCVAGCANAKSDPFKQWGAEDQYEDYLPPTAQAVT